MFAGDRARAVGAAGVLEAVGLPAPLADVRLRHVALADFGAGQVDPGVTLVAFDHGPAGEGLHAETRHQVPGVVIWGQRTESQAGTSQSRPSTTEQGGLQRT